MDNLSKLPMHCYATMPSDGSLIIIKRGETGYYPTEGYTTNDLFPTFAAVANLLNDKMGVSRAQRMAMEIGSMCGFDVPGADPDKHTVAAIIEQVRELPGTAEIAEEIVRMRQHGYTAEQIKERFNRLLDEARPDLAAQFRAEQPA